MTIYTTLNQIKQHDPCTGGWTKLLKFLNKTEADDEPLNLLTILESNGVQDCIWAFRTTDDYPVYRLISADFAESVLHIFEEKFPNDDRPRKAIQAVRDYANGLISKEELDAAGAAAGDAAGAAAGDAARAAAWAAAWAAARDAARAAGDAAGAAAGAAAWAAARATWAAAWAAELEKQRQITLKHLS